MAAESVGGYPCGVGGRRGTLADAQGIGSQPKRPPLPVVALSSVANRLLLVGLFWMFKKGRVKAAGGLPWEKNAATPVCGGQVGADEQSNAQASDTGSDRTSRFRHRSQTTATAGEPPIDQMEVVVPLPSRLPGKVVALLGAQLRFHQPCRWCKRTERLMATKGPARWRFAGRLPAAWRRRGCAQLFLTSARFEVLMFSF